MKTQKLVNAVKGFIAEQVRSFSEPSERKVERAEKKVESLRHELEQAERDAHAASADWMAFRKECETQLRENRAHINRFKKKMEKAGDRIRMKLGEKVAELERKNWMLERRLGKYQEEVMSKWGEFRDVVRGDVQEIVQSLKGLTGTVLRVA